MSTCSQARKHLAEFALGESIGEASRLVTEHLEGCPDCRSEATEYKELMSVSRAALMMEGALSEAAISRISRQAAEAVNRPSWWSRLVPMQVTPVLAAVVPAMVALLALGIGLAVRSGRTVESSPQTPARLDMQVEANGVRLAWTDGRGRAYKVYKTSDPRLLGRGKGTVVQGNQWLDQEPNSSPVVFYRVE
jgi:predicted anti-sigma-YlaC factor YlaD